MNSTARALLDRAIDSNSPDSVLFARLIGARIEQGDLPLLGLDAGALANLIGRHFPGATFEHFLHLTPRTAFTRDLHALLMWHDRTTTRHRDDAHGLATIICAASLRPDHLWRDLGLSGRDDVTDMLTRHYPALVARNVTNMRWKKFLAAEVAHARGEAPTCAPGCPGCEDYAFCYPGNR
ncbi:hydrogenase [Caballeronia arvi]|uniref:Hydrogenase n=1 Tax=Caballeronia arvi TaxID=1777135 RepID=A0A158IUK8_9BURK|nr:nitrogen fixation protein NifQ [Caballeronia arvi]SAL60277.1 hydrogenase [Caballeronia arvi]